MFNKLVKSVKTTMESIEMIKNTPDIVFAEETIEGVELIINSGFVRRTGCMIGISFRNISGNKMIAIEEGLPSFVESFVLQHELGHINLGHLDEATANQESNFKYVLKRSLSKHVDQRELDADAYACERVGKDTSIKALMWMYEKTLQDEILKRVNALID